MRKLILITNTPLMQVESAVTTFLEQYKERKGSELSYEVVYGRSDYPPRLHRKDIVVCLGHDSLKCNMDIIKQEAVVVLLGDPMNLACIIGSGIERFDFKPKEDAIGIYLLTRPEAELATSIRKGYFSDGYVVATALDHIPNTLVPKALGNIKDTTTFAKEFMSLNYSVRNEIDRDRIRRTLFKWVMTTDPVEVLQEALINITGKNSAPVRNLCDTFRPEVEKYRASATAIRSALTSVFRLVVAGKNNIPFEKIAENNRVSAYDLRYSSYLFRKDTLLLADVMSSSVHYSNSKSRTQGDENANV
jgi:hypothetical protein